MKSNENYQLEMFARKKTTKNYPSVHIGSLEDLRVGLQFRSSNYFHMNYGH
jgi:hypothetical protein